MRSLLIAPLALTILALGSAADGETLLVANKSDDTVDLLDLATGKSHATLPTGVAPHEIAVSPDGRTAVIANYGDRDTPGSTLTVVDISAARVARTVDLGDHTRPHGVAFLSADKVVVTTEGSRHLLVVEPSTGSVVTAVETAQRVSHMVALAQKLERAFVANIGSGSVTVIDLASGSKLADIPTGDGAEGIAITPDGAEVWVGNRGADTISILDPESLEVLVSIPCPGFPIRVAMTPDGRRALVSAAQSGEVVLFDVQKRQEIARSALDLANAPDAAQRLFGDRFGQSPVPVGVVVSPGGDRAWVAATQADAVVAIEPGSLEIRNVLEAGREPDGMAFSPLSVEPR
jgi:YVTN family beta-propeller protein